MIIDPDNPVVQLCAAGMAVEGDASAALALFLEAWEARRDDYDASIAAHFVARHQATPEETLHWNALAARHAEAVTVGRANELLGSLYLNLGEAHRAVGNQVEAASAAGLARATLEHLLPGGYRDFLGHGIQRLQARLTQAMII